MYQQCPFCLAGQGKEKGQEEEGYAQPGQALEEALVIRADDGGFLVKNNGLHLAFQMIP